MDERSRAVLLSHLPPSLSGEKKFSERLSQSPSLPSAADLLRLVGISIFETARKESEKSERFLDENPEVHLLHYWSENYPARLRSIPSPPWVLFFSGKISEAVPHLGVVGTRRPNSYGLEAVYRLLGSLKTFPMRVVSGLALGIDSAAHDAANLAGVPNVAVLGNGIAQIYPVSNRGLAKEILARGGCIISEYPPRMPAYPGNFPRRNRIISGLSDVLFVVQGSVKSGTVHTVKYALEQSRTICVLPGDIFSELSEVPHRFLRDGAFPIHSADDLDQLLQQSRFWY